MKSYTSLLFLTLFTLLLVSTFNRSGCLCASINRKDRSPEIKDIFTFPQKRVLVKRNIKSFDEYDDNHLYFDIDNFDKWVSNKVLNRKLWYPRSSVLFTQQQATNYPSRT